MHSSQEIDIICALSESDASLSSALQEIDMELQDFIVLSFISDQGPISSDRLASLVGFDFHPTLLSIRRLIDIGFLRYDMSADAAANDVIATDLGDGLAKKILSQL